MDVKLPNGTLVQGVPDDWTKDQFIDWYVKGATKRLAAGEKLPPEHLQNLSDLGVKTDFADAPALPPQTPEDVPDATTGRPPASLPPGFESFKPKPPTLMQGAALGPTKAVYETGLGLAGLLPGVDTRAAVDESRKYGDIGAVGDVGRFGMDVAMSALPAAGVLKGTQALGLAGRMLPAAANVAGQVGVGAAQGAAAPLGTEDSRATSAGIGAAGALGGEAISGAAGLVRKIPYGIRSLLGSKVTPQYQEALDAAARQGIPLNTAQQVNNPTLRGVSNILDTLSMGAPIAETQDKVIGQRAADLMEAAGGEISPDQAARQLQAQLSRQIGDTSKVPVPGAAPDRGALGRQMGGQYDELLRGRDHAITPETTADVEAVLARFAGVPAAPQAGVMNTGQRLAVLGDPDLDAQAGSLLQPGELGGTEFQEARSLFSKAAREKTGTPTGRAAGQLHNAMNRSFGREYGEGELRRLTDLDAAYAQFLLNREAIPAAPESVLSALKKGDIAVTDATSNLGARGAQRTARQSAVSDLIGGARDKATREVNPEQLAKAIGAESKSSLARKFGSSAGDAEDIRRAIAEVIQPETSSYGKWRKAQAELTAATGGLVGGAGQKLLTGLTTAGKALVLPTLANKALNSKATLRFLQQQNALPQASMLLRPGVNAALSQILLEQNQ